MDSLSSAHVLRAFVEGRELPEHGPLTKQMGALYIEEWWPAAVRLNDKCFFVRIYDDGPMPEITTQISAMLAEAGLRNFGTEDAWPLVDGLTLQRLGVVGATWQVWADNFETAKDSVEKGAVDTVGTTPSEQMNHFLTD